MGIIDFIVEIRAYQKNHNKDSNLKYCKDVCDIIRGMGLIEFKHSQLGEREIVPGNFFYFQKLEK